MMRTTAFIMLLSITASGVYAQKHEYSPDRVYIDIRRGPSGYYDYGFRVGQEALVSLECLVLMGLDPRFEPQTGVITLKVPEWWFRCRLGSKKAIVNGKVITLPVVPRLKKVKVSPETEPVSKPFVPVVAIAKMRGYQVEFIPQYGDMGPAFILTSPDSYLPPKDFIKQRIASPAVRRSGELEAEAGLSIRQGYPTGSKEAAYYVGAGVTITNKGKKTYVASDEFLFLEMWDGTVRRGDQGSESYTAREHQILITPGKSGSVAGGTWLFPVDTWVPIKRILYIDGCHRFEWQVKEEREEPKER